MVSSRLSSGFAGIAALAACPLARADQIELAPPSPTASDVITLRVQGTKPTPCWDVVGNLVIAEDQLLDVRILLRLRSGPCMQVVAPYQTTVTLGQLPAGAYRAVVSNQAVDQDPTPTWAELYFTVLPGEGEEPHRPFVRGDVNQDRLVELSDAIAILGSLFLGAPPSACRDTEDANDDARIDISDALAILRWSFLAGPPIPAPHPGCGSDPTADAMSACDYAPGEC